MSSMSIRGNTLATWGGGGGGGLRGPDDHIISCHSKTPDGTTFKLGDFFLSIRHILDEIQQNRSTSEIATADF